MSQLYVCTVCAEEYAAPGMCENCQIDLVPASEEDELDAYGLGVEGDDENKDDEDEEDDDGLDEDEEGFGVDEEDEEEDEPGDESLDDEEEGGANGFHEVKEEDDEY